MFKMSFKTWVENLDKEQFYVSEFDPFIQEISKN